MTRTKPYRAVAKYNRIHDRWSGVVFAPGYAKVICPHRHRSEDTALRCAEAEAKRMEQG